ncbi:AbrB/MazE/SpoVT family DNA-binding domain-containing protein [Ottowia testudinis]|uniref:AbrB/MazE/SpoVT family DNA-binding domain-containing protein n=1 Tax=Ottowia testudinis TaxID=2816950 RepID=A0A975CF79_9BURK|nr:AbrB/MazE/SpoVT family DNA-binding domain-containing protein [Ottowia testudinis]QTD45305.1 AbrB/MazE/SpoVT family DNA-binding domain-containing protein [Ottowia testudinis]
MGAFSHETQQSLELSVGRWGNSLAVRLPAELARQLGVVEGSTLHARRNDEANTLTLSAKPAKKPFDKAKWMAQAQQHLATMAPSPSVMDEVRGNARY